MLVTRYVHHLHYTCLVKFYFHCKSINLIFRLILGFWIVDESSSSLVRCISSSKRIQLILIIHKTTIPRRRTLGFIACSGAGTHDEVPRTNHNTQFTPTAKMLLTLSPWKEA